MKKLGSTYSFSFTAATMRLPDFMRLLESQKTNKERISYNDVDQEGVLNKGNQRTSKREMQELIKRFNTLTHEQRALLYSANLDVRKQISFLAICKTYDFVRDFTIEVVREKMLVFDFQLEAGDLNTFINRKKDLHPELDEFADSTLKKAKQHTFKILHEAGIINTVRDKVIQPQFVDEKTMSVIIEENPEYLKLFLLSDKDIQLALIS